MQYQGDPNTAAAAMQALDQQRHAAQRTYLLASDAAYIVLVTANGQAAVAHQNAVNGIEKTKADAYAHARQTYNDAVNAAAAAYASAMGQPAADLQTAKANALQTYADAAASAGQTLADSCRPTTNRPTIPG